jgi:hypothetical protein
MATKVYGASDDLVEVEGDIDGEVNSYGTDERERGVLLVFSDGTLLEAKYGKADSAIWEVKLLAAGSLFDRIEPCLDADGDPNSDIAHFRDGLKWVYAATRWERVR